MGPAQAIKTCLAKSFQFKSRASRSACWYLILTMLLFSAIPRSTIAEPYQAVLAACENTAFDLAKEYLTQNGWREISNAETYEAARLEIRFQHVRAKLSRASYPERWSDEVVLRVFPSRSGTSLASLSAHQREAISLDRYPSDSVPKAVFEAHTGQGILVLHGDDPWLQCWFSGFQNENTTLVNSILTTDRMREAGYGPVRRFIDDYQIYVATLPDHALQPDDHFPVTYDFTFALYASAPNVRSNP